MSRTTGIKRPAVLARESRRSGRGGRRCTPATDYNCGPATTTGGGWRAEHGCAGSVVEEEDEAMVLAFDAFKACDQLVNGLADVEGGRDINLKALVPGRVGAGAIREKQIPIRGAGSDRIVQRLDLVLVLHPTAVDLCLLDVLTQSAQLMQEQEAVRMAIRAPGLGLSRAFRAQVERQAARLKGVVVFIAANTRSQHAEQLIVAVGEALRPWNARVRRSIAFFFGFPLVSRQPFAVNKLFFVAVDVASHVVFSKAARTRAACGVLSLEPVGLVRSQVNLAHVDGYPKGKAKDGKGEKAEGDLHSSALGFLKQPLNRQAAVVLNGISKASNGGQDQDGDVDEAAHGSALHLGGLALGLDSLLFAPQRGLHAVPYGVWQFIGPLADRRCADANGFCGCGDGSTKEFKCFGFLHEHILVHLAPHVKSTYHLSRFNRA